MISSNTSSPNRLQSPISIRLRRLSSAGVALAVVVLLCGCGSALASGGAQVVTASEDISIQTSWRVFTADDGLPHDSVRAIRVFGDQVWVGTDGGLAMYERGQWKTWTRSDGLPVSAVSAIDIDPETLDVWLGTWGGGLVRLSGGRFNRYNQFNSGLAGDLVFDVAVTQGRVWAATCGGVSSYDPSAEVWELYYPRKAYAPDLAVTTFAVEHDQLYAGLWQAGVERFNPATRRWTTIAAGPSDTQSQRLPASDAVGIVANGKSLWWATQNAVLRKPRSDSANSQADDWPVWPIPRTQTHPEFVQCVASPDDAQVWLGTNRGVYVLAEPATNGWLHLQSDSTVTVHGHDGQVEVRRLAATIPDNRIRCVAFEGDVVWVGTADGLARGDNSKPLATLPLSADDGASVQPRPAVEHDHGESSGTARSETSEAPTTRVAVAIYGPRSRTVALPGKMRGVPSEPGRPDLLAVGISINHANARGGYRSTSPFTTVKASAGYARYGWGLPEDNIAVFARDRRVMGMVGYLVPDQHVADAVVLRTEVPWMNVAPANVSGDPFTEGNPWIFRCHGDEPGRHRMLLDSMIERLGSKRIALVRTAGRAAATRLDWWRSHAEQRGLAVVAEPNWSHERGDQTETLAVLRATKPDAVVTWSDKNTTAELLREIRAAGMNQTIVVSSDCVADDFVPLVGVDPGEVITLDPATPEPVAQDQGHNDSVSKNWSFAKRYVDRNVVRQSGAQPNAHAYRSYAATEHLLHAVNEAGSDRETVRWTLEAMSRSSMGEAHYEKLFEVAPTRFARLQAGKWIYHPFPSGRAETSPEH